MNRALTCLLVFSAWQTGCTDAGNRDVMTNQALLNGEPSQKPNIVFVRTTENSEEQVCTGVLLLPNLVLTARHCLTLDRTAIQSGDCKKGIVEAPSNFTQISVITGKDASLSPVDSAYEVDEAWLPEDDARLCGQDLALLLLKRSLSETPLTLTTELPKDNPAFTAYGYGLADGDYGQQRVFKNAQITFYGTDSDDPRVAKNEFLANSGVCEGDSGGPAIDSEGRVFAIASRTAEDCSESAYVTFSEHINWLATAARDAAALGHDHAPDWAKGSVDTSNIPTVDESENRNDRLNAAGGCQFVRAKSFKDNGSHRFTITLALVLFATAAFRRKGNLTA